MINQTASTVALARQLLMDLDRHAVEVRVATPTFELLLTTLIDLASADNQTARKIEAAHSGLVAARITGIEKR
jgi:hypothetical protein